MPTLLYADFVMSIQMVYGAALTLGNTLSAKALHIRPFLSLGCVGFVAFGRRFFGTASGWLAALFFFSMPMVAVNATTAGTDVAGAFLLFAGAAALVLAAGTSTPHPLLFKLGRRAHGHAAASTKYPAFCLYSVSMLCCGSSGILPAMRKSPGGNGCLFFSAFHARPRCFPVGALILLKNIAFHGNPLYPFGGTSFGRPRLDPLEWRKFVSDTSPRDLAGDVFIAGRRIHLAISSPRRGFWCI